MENFVKIMNNFSFKPVNKHTFTNKSIINVVPCVIDYQGKASVNDYFNKKTLKNEGFLKKITSF